MATFLVIRDWSPSIEVYCIIIIRRYTSILHEHVICHDMLLITKGGGGGTRDIPSTSNLMFAGGSYMGCEIVNQQGSISLSI